MQNKINVKELKAVCLANTGDLLESLGGKDYVFIDRGSDILGIAHLDTVFDDSKGDVPFGLLSWSNGYRTIYSGKLDDRLGVYALLYYLRKEINYDILLTTGEESFRSTGFDFAEDNEKEYKWMFELDRAGSDVVLYHYEDDDTVEMCEKAGWKVGFGSVSDISSMEFMGVKGFNFGIGYQSQHTKTCYVDEHVFLKQMRKFYNFYKMWKGFKTEHIFKGTHTYRAVGNQIQEWYFRGGEVDGYGADYNWRDDSVYCGSCGYPVDEDGAPCLCERICEDCGTIMDEIYSPIFGENKETLCRECADLYEMQYGIEFHLVWQSRETR